MRSAAQEERSRSPKKTRIKRFPQSDETIIHGFEAIGDAVQEFLHNAQNTHEPTLEMKKWLVERLSEGKFTASGVRSLPAGEVELRPIPPHFFKGDPKIKWPNAIVENFGQKYEAVEIRKKNNSPEKTRIPKQKVGRPRKSDKLEKVVSELQRAGRFDGLIEKQRVALAQKECRNRYPSDFPKEPAPTSVRKALKSLK